MHEPSHFGHLVKRRIRPLAAHFYRLWCSIRINGLTRGGFAFHESRSVSPALETPVRKTGALPSAAVSGIDERVVGLPTTPSSRNTVFRQHRVPVVPVAWGKGFTLSKTFDDAIIIAGVILEVV